MPAEINTDGIVFSNSTTITTRGWMTPDNTSMFFFQAAAPLNWVKSTANNDKMFRVVSGTGGGTGGSVNFNTISGRSFTFPYSTSGAVTNNTTLTSNQIPAHTHLSMGTELSPFPQNPNGTYNGGDVNKGTGWTRSFQSTGGVSGPAQHSHPFSSSGTSPSISCNINVQYIDIIQCNFDIDA